MEIAELEALTERLNGQLDAVIIENESLKEVSNV